MFHLLAAEGESLLSPTLLSGLKRALGLAFDHGQIRRACTGIAKRSMGRPGNQKTPETPNRFSRSPLNRGLSRSWKLLLIFGRPVTERTVTWQIPVEEAIFQVTSVRRGKSSARGDMSGNRLEHRCSWRPSCSSDIGRGDGPPKRRTYTLAYDRPPSEHAPPKHRKDPAAPANRIPSAPVSRRDAPHRL